MMLAAVGSINGFPESRHLSLARFQTFPRFIQFFLQGFDNVLYKYTGGMLCVVHSHSLCVGFRLQALGTRLAHRAPQGAYGHQCGHQAAAQ